MIPKTTREHLRLTEKNDMPIQQIKTLLSILYPIVIVILTILGLVSLSDLISTWGAIACGLLLIFLARYL